MSYFVTGHGQQPWPHKAPKWFNELSIAANSGKMLATRYSRGRYVYQRNREAERTYYLTRLHGNWITSYRIKHYDGDKVIDLYMLHVGALLGAAGVREQAARIRSDMQVIVKTPIRQTVEHGRLFRAATPDLKWWEETEFAEQFEESRGTVDPDLSLGFGDNDELA